MRYARFILIPLLTCSLSACANWFPVYHSKISQGNPQIHKNHAKIKIGMTRASVVHLIGKPLLTPFFANKNTWTYVHQTASNQAVLSESLIVSFNRKGRVDSVVYNPAKESKASKTPEFIE